MLTSFLHLSPAGQIVFLMCYILSSWLILCTHLHIGFCEQKKNIIKIIGNFFFFSVKERILFRYDNLKLRIYNKDSLLCLKLFIVHIHTKKNTLTLSQLIMLRADNFGGVFSRKLYFTIA